MKDWQEWQEPYQFGTIVILPPVEIRSVVNNQREVYDPASLSICETHITVTQPLLRNLSEAEWDHVKHIVESFNRFQIEYGPLNSFLPYPCIWYEIRPIEKVLEIRQTLHQTGFFNLDLPHTDDFIPHMTITEGLSGPTVDEDLLNKLQEESNSETFQCQELVHIAPDPDFRFQTIKTLSLKAH